MHTKLAPIEKPNGLIKKIAYWMTKRQYGKVITPLKVIYSRLPASFGLWANRIETLASRLSLGAEISMLVKTYVAQMNTCAFCIDIGTAKAIEKLGNNEKFFCISEYRTSPLFTGKERAALAFAEELTKHKRVSPENFVQAQKYFNERQLCELAWAVAAEHVYNIMNIAFDIESDGLCSVKPAGKTQAA